MVTTIAGSQGQAGLADGSGSAARFNSPNGLAVDGMGNVVVADTGNDAIRKITPSGMVTTIAGGIGRGYVNGPALTAQFDNPFGVAVDSAGNIYVADEYNCSIRKISSSGMVGTVAGAGPASCRQSDGVAGAANMLWPRMLVATSVDEVIFVEAFGSHLRLARGDGSILTVAGSYGNFGLSDGQGTAALFSQIGGIANDGRGNVYVADSANHAIRLVRPNFAVSTLIRNLPPNTVLGDPPSIRNPTGIALLPGNGIAISTEAAIVLD